MPLANVREPNVRKSMETSSLFSETCPDNSDICRSPAGQIVGLTKPNLLDKAWSSDGWKMARRAAQV
jgi:hypothetical protein